jgi:hypothetical protein
MVAWHWDVCFKDLAGRGITLSSRHNIFYFPYGFVRNDTPQSISLEVPPNAEACDHFGMLTLEGGDYPNTILVLVYSGIDGEGNELTIESPTLLSPIQAAEE